MGPIDRASSYLDSDLLNPFLGRAKIPPFLKRAESPAIALAESTSDKVGYVRSGWAKNPSKLDGRDEEIELLLKKGVSKAAIAKIMGVSRTALYHFICTRKVGPEAKRGGSRA